MSWTAWRSWSTRLEIKRNIHVSMPSSGSGKAAVITYVIENLLTDSQLNKLLLALSEITKRFPP